MRIIPSEDDGFVLVTLDFASLNQLFLLRMNTLQKDRSGFIVRALWNKLFLNCFLQLTKDKVLIQQPISRSRA